MSTFRGRVVAGVAQSSRFNIAGNMRQGQCENGGPRSEYRIQLDNWFMLLDLCLADDSLVFCAAACGS